jgi:hypothetical protein
MQGQTETINNRSYVGAAGSAAAETRQAEVPHQIDMLQRNARGLAEVVGNLEMRLGGVTRPEPPANQIEKAPVRNVPATGIGSQMQDVNDELVQIRVRAESILSRLEV